MRSTSVLEGVEVVTLFRFVVLVGVSGLEEVEMAVFFRFFEVVSGLGGERVSTPASLESASIIVVSASTRCSIGDLLGVP